LLAHGRWFSPGTPASSTTKTGRHDIAEILLKVVLNTKKINQSINVLYATYLFYIHFTNILIYHIMLYLSLLSQQIIMYRTGRIMPW
jgi:hypothetical protein